MGSLQKKAPLPLGPLPSHVLKDLVVLRLTEAEQALTTATEVDQIKLVMDVAAAQLVFARRQQLGEEVIGFAHAIKMRALARLGSLLAHRPKRAGGRGLRGGGRRGLQREPHPNPPPSLEDLGLTKKLSLQAQQLAALPTDTQEAVFTRKTKLTQEVRRKRHERARQQAQDLPAPVGLYDAIAIDPPWRYDRQPTDSDLRGECDYATLSIEELQAVVLPAADNCVLWLWTTNSFMREAYALVDTWGFAPKTILTWDKVNLGLGSWLRNVTEHCLVAVRGRPVVTLTNQTTLIREPRREHSQKPDAFYQLVESLCPGRKLDYFSRTDRPGWDGYGLERNTIVEKRA